MLACHLLHACELHGNGINFALNVAMFTGILDFKSGE